jgi:hypothetical protein
MTRRKRFTGKAEKMSNPGGGKRKSTLQHRKSVLISLAGIGNYFEASWSKSGIIGRPGRR